jgi:hypothetical protein
MMTKWSNEEIDNTCKFFIDRGYGGGLGYDKMEIMV